MAIVRAKPGQVGPIVLTAQAPGLTSSRVEVRAAR
jgi:beta-galactosidase